MKKSMEKHWMCYSEFTSEQARTVSQDPKKVSQDVTVQQAVTVLSIEASGVCRNFFSEGGFQHIQLTTVDRENGDLGV